MRVRGAEAMVRNKAMRRRGMAPRNVVSYLECLRRVDGRKESICAAFDWISEKLLQGEVDPKTAQQLRVLAGRRNRVMASYSKPCSRRSPQRATLPPGVPEPDLPPLGMDENHDAPTGILGANTGTPVHGDEAPPFDLPPAPPFDL